MKMIISVPPPPLPAGPPPAPPPITSATAAKKKPATTTAASAATDGVEEGGGNGGGGEEGGENANIDLQPGYFDLTHETTVQTTNLNFLMTSEGLQGFMAAAPGSFHRAILYHKV